PERGALLVVDDLNGPAAVRLPGTSGLPPEPAGHRDLLTLLQRVRADRVPGDPGRVARAVDHLADGGLEATGRREHHAVVRVVVRGTDRPVEVRLVGARAAL